MCLDNMAGVCWARTKCPTTVCQYRQTIMERLICDEFVTGCHKNYERGIYAVIGTYAEVLFVFM